MFKSTILMGIIAAIIFTICIFPINSNADIMVSDNNDKKLGFLLDMDGSSIKLFLPSINATYRIYGDKFGDLSMVSTQPWILFFESNDCSGTPYTQNLLPDVIDLKNSDYDGFYLPNISNSKEFQPKSTYSVILFGDGTPTCSEYTIEPTLMKYYELNKVELPFSFPISLPLKFNIESRSASTSDFFIIPVRKK